MYIIGLGPSKFEPTMKYLEHPHRHMFHIDARREVFHDDRDVEFIVFKRMMKDYIEKTYYNHEIDCCDFEVVSLVKC